MYAAASPTVVIFWASCSKRASSPVTIRSPSVIVTFPFASTLCGSCADVCPVRIDLHHPEGTVFQRAAFDTASGFAVLQAHPDTRLLNLVMQRRAKWLLSRTEELFLKASPADGQKP